jgi:hypothetical protein
VVVVGVVRLLVMVYLGVVVVVPDQKQHFLMWEVLAFLDRE